MIIITKTPYKKLHKKDQKYQLWQEGFHPQAILDEEMLLQKLEYIHNNPVEAGLVGRAEDYLFSSAQDYSGQKGPVKVSVINLHNLF